MSEFEELIYGKEYAQAHDKLKTEIAALDQKYPDILEEGDSFNMHVVMTTNILPGRITFDVKDDEGRIPQHIKNEMTSIFNSVFGAN